MSGLSDLNYRVRKLTVLSELLKKSGLHEKSIFAELVLRSNYEGETVVFSCEARTKKIKPVGFKYLIFPQYTVNQVIEHPEAFTTEELLKVLWMQGLAPAYHCSYVGGFSLKYCKFKFTLQKTAYMHAVTKSFFSWIEAPFVPPIMIAKKKIYNGTEPSSSKRKELNLEDWLEHPCALVQKDIDTLVEQITDENYTDVLELYNSNLINEECELLYSMETMWTLHCIAYPKHKIKQFSTITTEQFANSLDEEFKEENNNGVVNMMFIIHTSIIKQVSFEYGITVDAIEDYHRPTGWFMVKLKRFFNTLYFKLTGKIRSLDMVNSCGWRAIRSYCDYNNIPLTESRAIQIISNIPNYYNKITWFGITARTMAEIVHQLQIDVDIYDLDLNIHFKNDPNEGVQKKGYIINKDNHYTFGLSELKMKNNTIIECQNFEQVSFENYNGGHILLDLFNVTLSAIGVFFRLTAAIAGSFVIGILSMITLKFLLAAAALPAFVAGIGGIIGFFLSLVYLTFALAKSS